MREHKRRSFLLFNFCVLLLLFSIQYMLTVPSANELTHANGYSSPGLFVQGHSDETHNARACIFYLDHVIFLSQCVRQTWGEIPGSRPCAEAFLPVGLLALLALILHKLLVYKRSFLCLISTEYSKINVIALSLGGHAPPGIPEHTREPMARKPYLLGGRPCHIQLIYS